MADVNTPIVLYGVDLVPIYGYTQTFLPAMPIAATLGLNKAEVVFTKKNALVPGGTPELDIIAGRVTIPDVATGRWTPQVVIDSTVALLLTVTIEVYDANNVLVGTVETTDYPAARQRSLAVGSSTDFVGFKPIGHIAGSGALTVRVYVTGGVGLNLTRMQLTLNKSG